MVSLIACRGDARFHQQFAETLVDKGVLDFSIQGCHGQSFLAAFIYYITGSPQSICYASLLMYAGALCLLYKIKKEAILLYLLIPYLYVDAVSGLTVNALAFVSLLIIYLAKIESRLTLGVYIVSVLFRPFALCLFPFLYPSWKKHRSDALWYVFGLISCAAVSLYLFESFQQSGRLFNAWSNAVTRNSPFIASLVQSPYDVIKNFGRLLIVATVDFDYNYARNYTVTRAMISPVVTYFGIKNIMANRRYLSLVAISANICMYAVIIYAFPKYLIPAYMVVIIAAADYIKNKDFLWLTGLTAFAQFYCFFHR